MVKIPVLVIVMLLFAGQAEGAPGSSRSNVVQFDEIRLNDLQGGYGGQQIIISPSGQYRIKIIRPSRQGLQTREFSGKLRPRDLNRLLRTFKKVRFETIQVRPRAGLPDEARPEIVLVKDGKKIKKSKWASDRHDRFDRLYGTLLAIIKHEEDRVVMLKH